MAKFADHMEKITEGVTEGYQKIEDGVVTGYKKIEGGVVEGFTGMVDKMSSMWCLLHENPGTSKMVGHAGSFLERKATDVLKTKKNKTGGVVSFTVSQSKARARDLDEWTFTIEDDEHHYGHPVLTGKTENSEGPMVVPIEKVKENLRQIEDKVQWPATNDQIEEALNQICLMTNHSERFDLIKKAKNRNWLKLDHKEGKLGFWNIELDPF